MLAETQALEDYLTEKGPDRMGVSNRAYAVHAVSRYGLYADVRERAGIL